MNWAEAYSRAARSALAIIVIYLAGIITAAIGGALANTENFAGMAIGIILVLLGVLTMILGMLAVWLKMITDSIVDNVKTDLSREIKELEAANRARHNASFENIRTELSRQIQQVADSLQHSSQQQTSSSSETVESR